MFYKFHQLRLTLLFLSHCNIVIKKSLYFGSHAKLMSEGLREYSKAKEWIRNRHPGLVDSLNWQYHPAFYHREMPFLLKSAYPLLYANDKEHTNRHCDDIIIQTICSIFQSFRILLEIKEYDVMLINPQIRNIIKYRLKYI